MHDTGIVMCDGKLRIFKDGSVRKITKSGEKPANLLHAIAGRKRKIKKLLVTYTTKDGKHRSIAVAKLVMMAYINPNYEALSFIERKIIYKDGDYTNCSVDNIRLVTVEEVDELYKSRFTDYKRCAKCNGLLKSYKDKVCSKCNVKSKAQSSRVTNKAKKLEKINNELKHIRIDILDDDIKKIVEYRRLGLSFDEIRLKVGSSRANVHMRYNNVIKHNGVVFNRSISLTIAENANSQSNSIPANYHITFQDMFDYGIGRKSLSAIAIKHRCTAAEIRCELQSIITNYLHNKGD